MKISSLKNYHLYGNPFDSHEVSSQIIAKKLKLTFFTYSGLGYKCLLDNLLLVPPIKLIMTQLMKVFVYYILVATWTLIHCKIIHIHLYYCVIL